MSSPSSEQETILAGIRAAVAQSRYDFSLHAWREAREETIDSSDAEEAIAGGRILENYPDHERGPCCLILGYTHGGRPLHVVATTQRDPLLIITVYEPTAPWWSTPEKRGERP